MKRRCTPRFVEKVHQKANSWRAAARLLNLIYGVDLSHLTWRDFSSGRRDIADPKVRAALRLGPRPCLACGDNIFSQFSRLLKHMKPRDIKHWSDLRQEGRYHAARRFLKIIYSQQQIARTMAKHENK